MKININLYVIFKVMLAFSAVLLKFSGESIEAWLVLLILISNSIWDELIKIREKIK